MKRINQFWLTIACACILMNVNAQTPPPQRDMLDIEIGQMILIGFAGTTVDSSVVKAIRERKVGSIIFFEKNVPKSGASFAALKKIIWTYQKNADIPLFVTIDQEGGKVNRLKDKYGFPRSITAQEMGRANTLDSVRFYAEAIASNLAGLGFNVNFAPVLDLGVNKKNTVIYTVGRSFSANADSVALLAGEYIRPHRRFGVITVLKHFPGHGSSDADTHFGMADVTKTWSSNELLPYQRLISSGSADAVMTAHIVNKQLDPRGWPGTLSNRIIDSLLRKQIGFQGVVFSDDMQMQAITKEYGLEEAIRRSILAGVDILCFSNNIAGSEERTVDKVHAIIRQMVMKGEIKRERIDESFNRIMNLKRKIGYSGEEVLRRQLEEAELKLRGMGTAPAVIQPSSTPAEPAPVQQPEENSKKKKRKKKNDL